MSDGPQGRARVGDERGFTLIEVIFAAALGLLVVAAAMAFVIVGLHQQNASASRATASRQAEAGLEQMVRDLRQAMSQDASGNALTATVSTSAAAKTTSVQFYIPTPGSDTTQQSVLWTCPSTAEPSTYVGACYRQLGSASSQPMVTGVQSMSFTPIDSSGAAHVLSTATSSSYTNPASVTMGLSLQVTSQAPNAGAGVLTGVGNLVTMSTTADLRNFS